MISISFIVASCIVLIISLVVAEQRPATALGVLIIGFFAVIALFGTPDL